MIQIGNMDRILVKDLLINGSYPEGGEKLYQLANPLIKDNQFVNIDMNEVESIPTLFMNTSFAKLITDFGKEKVMSTLRFYNISKTQLDRIRKYFNSFE